RNLDRKARPHAADQPRRQQRMTPERKEVVVDADPPNPEHLGKQRTQQLLLRRARRAIARSLRPQLRLRQRRTVELAVRRQRKPRRRTWPSARPTTPTTPSERHPAQSPLRYIRLPAGPCGSATTPSPVSPARPR